MINWVWSCLNWFLWLTGNQQKVFDGQGRWSLPGDQDTGHCSPHTVLSGRRQGGWLYGSCQSQHWVHGEKPPHLFTRYTSSALLTFLRMFQWWIFGIIKTDLQETVLASILERCNYWEKLPWFFEFNYYIFPKMFSVFLFCCVFTMYQLFCNCIDRSRALFLSKFT